MSDSAISIGERAMLVLENNPYIYLIGITIIFVVMLVFFLMLKHRQDKAIDELKRIELEKNEKLWEQNIENQERQVRIFNDIIYEKDRNEALRQEQSFNSIKENLLQYEGRMNRLDALLSEKLNESERKNELLREQVFIGMEKIKQIVDENLQSGINKRFSEGFSLVNDRLEKVYTGLGAIKQLNDGVGDLKKIFSNVKNRGVWGEVQLGALIREELSANQYIENAQPAPDSRERVEFAIKLPLLDDKDVLLAVDAKFPLESYMRLQNSSEAEMQALYKNELMHDILREAKRISSKYIVPPYTADFAVMYLPLEGLFIEVSQMPELLDRIQRENRVMLAGPSTFSALLTSLQMSFKTVAIQKNSVEVMEAIQVFKREFGKFNDLIEKSGQRLRLANESIDELKRKSIAIENKLSDLVKVD